MFSRYFQPPDKSFFLFGARGTGKSTWMRYYYPNAIIIDLLEPDQYRKYSAKPERLKEFVLAHPDNSVFVIDEIQKNPALLSVVHLLIEMKRGWVFVLTASSARKLKRSGVDLLAGRALLKHMHPFMASEMGAHFNYEDSLRYGLLPLVSQSKTPKEDLNTYVALYMKEEVEAEGLVRNIGPFARFLEAISFSQASTLNYSNIARDCEVSGKTIESYVSILQDLLLAVLIPVFTKKSKRALSSKSKFYYFDVGVYHAIRPRGLLDNTQAMRGHAVETLVAQHLLAWIDYSTLSGQLFFWHTKAGLEVDFIIYGEIGFYAIEVKMSEKINPKDLRGLTEFKKDYPQARCLLLYGGADKLQKGDITCIPIQQFLMSLCPNGILEAE